MSGERYVLALDTATAPGGVAIGRGTEVIAEVVLGVAERHSELVLPAIDFVLRMAGTTIEGVDAIVCGAGPGSFTGVRIGAATAKGLAHARGIALFAYPSLLAAAAAAAHDGEAVCALFDARRGEAYAGCWSFDHEGAHTLLAPTADEVDTIVAKLRPHDPLYVGDGALRNRTAIRELGGRVGRRGETAGCAGALVRLHALATSAVPVDASHWQPDYVRAPHVTVPRDARTRAGDTATDSVAREAHEARG